MFTVWTAIEAILSSAAAFLADWIILMRLSAYYTSESPGYRVSALRGALIIVLSQYTFWLFSYYAKPNSMPLYMLAFVLGGLGLYVYACLQDLRKMVAQSAAG